MLEIPVYNTEGKKTDTISVEETVFGGEVNVALVKQAVVTYHANKRQGTVASKGRGQVAGSTRKLFKQKGSGNARRGSIRAVGLRGGGNAFSKQTRDHRKKFPKKMRLAARNSAILAKILGEDLAVVEGLSCDAPKTSEMATLLKNLKINRSCLLALAERDSNIYLSSRNLQDLTVRIAEELNAFDIATRQKMLITKEAMQALIAQKG